MIAKRRREEHSSQRHRPILGEEAELVGGHLALGRESVGVEVGVELAQRAQIHHRPR